MKFITKVILLVSGLAALTEVYSFLEEHPKFLSLVSSFFPVQEESIPFQPVEPNNQSHGEQFCSTFLDDDGCFEGRLLTQREPVSYHHDHSSQRKNVGTNQQAFCARFPNDYSCP